VLAGGTVTRAELEAQVGKESAGGIGLWLDLVRAPPSGTWQRRRADLYAAAEDWLGPPAVDADEAVAHLVRRYLRAFGAAPPADAADWAGMPIGDVTRALAGMRLRRLRGEGGEELVDLPRAPLPQSTPGAPGCFPRSTGRGSSARACRPPCRRSSLAARSPAAGATTAGESSSTPSAAWTLRRGVRSPRRAERLAAFHA
jgi:hypothetical protein